MRNQSIVLLKAFFPLAAFKIFSLFLEVSGQEGRAQSSPSSSGHWEEDGEARRLGLPMALLTRPASDGPKGCRGGRRREPKSALHQGCAKDFLRPEPGAGVKV